MVKLQKKTRRKYKAVGLQVLNLTIKIITDSRRQAAPNNMLVPIPSEGNFPSDPVPTSTHVQQQPAQIQSLKQNVCVFKDWF